jgi:hypothetical protein
MIKYLRVVLFVLLLPLSNSLCAQYSNWSFVGPVSNNNANGHEFEPAQVHKIVIDPANLNHMFTGGPFAGLWESNNAGASWQNVNANPAGFNGVLGLCFLSSTQLLVGNYHVGFNAGLGSHDVSTGVKIYNFQSQTWSSLGALPVGSQNYVIKNISVYPSDHTIIFVCTSIGLFRSQDSGATWTEVITNKYPENMVFIAKTSGTDYFCYVAGSNAVGLWGEPPGVPMLMESSDKGLTFPVDLSSSITLGSGQTRGHSTACIGPQNGTSDRQLFTMTNETPGTPEGWDVYGWDVYGGGLYLDQFSKNANTNVVTHTALSPYGLSGMGGLREAVAYDPANNYLWFGSQHLNYLDLASGNATYYVQYSMHSGTNGGIHDDMHDIEIVNNAGQYTMYVAHDGGVVSSPLSTGPIPFFSRLNYGLDVCLVNGFSGSEDQPNIYALGGQDIVNTDIYDANLQQDKYTLATWENDGAIIDKFNSNNMIFDASSYGGAYLTTSNGGATVSGTKSYFAPASGSTFAQGASDGTDAWGFMAHNYYQDPYRAGRIFQGKDQTGIYQYDWASQTFVAKIKPFSIQPNIVWSGGPCSPNASGGWNLQGWVRVNGMSFSPQTPNSLHFIVDGSYDPANPACYANPSVIKYIGSNLDDVWSGHNDAYNTSNPQWANISPNWASFASTVGNCTSCANVAGSDLGIQFKDIETSPWNKDRIYVALYIPNNPTVRVLKYDGTTWSNYSDGLPPNEGSYAMVMDHASNDGLYLSTDMGIYFRDATMASWIPYSNDLPITFSRQLEINYKENTLRAGMYGRGIWKSPLSCPTQTNLTLSSTIAANIYEANYVTASSNATLTLSPTVFRGTNSVTLSPGFKAAPSSTPNTYCLALIHGCSGGGTSTYQYHRLAAPPEPHAPKKSEVSGLTAYPSPNDGHFTVLIPGGDDEDRATVTIYDPNGKQVFSRGNILERQLSFDFSEFPKGMYMIRCVIDGEGTSTKVMNQ